MDGFFKSKAAQLLKDLIETDLKHRFEQQKIRTTRQYVDRKGEYFEDKCESKQ